MKTYSFIDLETGEVVVQTIDDAIASGKGYRILENINDIQNVNTKNHVVEFTYSAPPKNIYDDKERPIQGNVSQRTDLFVSFIDKDEAKKCGAKWDAENKTWYCLGNTTKFTKWLKPSPSQVKRDSVNANDRSITLNQYFSMRGTNIKILNRAEAKVLGIKYPLKKGWATKHGNMKISKAMVKKLNEAIATTRYKRK